jgi:hypothetical protein
MELHSRDQPFVCAVSNSVACIPVDLAQVFDRMRDGILRAGAGDPKQTPVLSREISPMRTERLFAVTRPVPGEEMVYLTGDDLTRVFEATHRDTRSGRQFMLAAAEARGRSPGPVCFSFTTCATCAEVCGRNYVVGIVRV